jgi:hypothetical protein
MQVKLTWSYSSTPTAQAPTQFTIQHKLTSDPDIPASYTTQAIITNFGQACSGGTCSYTYPASGTLNHNTSYDFRIATDCSEGNINYSTPVTKINVLCPSYTPTATSNSISYSFSGATGTSVTGYVVELLNNGSVVESKPLASVAATISGTFSGLSSTTAYVVRVTVKSSGADRVCTQTLSTTNTPSCNGVINLSGCICGGDCAQAC